MSKTQIAERSKALKIILGVATGCFISILVGIIVFGIILLQGLSKGLSEAPVDIEFLGLVHVESSNEAGVSATIGANGLTAFLVFIVLGASAGALISWLRYRSECKAQNTLPRDEQNPQPANA